MHELTVTKTFSQNPSQIQKKKIDRFCSLLACYCTPPVAAPDVIGAKAVWRKKSKRPSEELNANTIKNRKSALRSGILFEGAEVMKRNI